MTLRGDPYARKAAIAFVSEAASEPTSPSAGRWTGVARSVLRAPMALGATCRHVLVVMGPCQFGSVSRAATMSLTSVRPV